MSVWLQDFSGQKDDNKNPQNCDYVTRTVYSVLLEGGTTESRSRVLCQGNFTLKHFRVFLRRVVQIYITKIKDTVRTQVMTQAKIVQMIHTRAEKKTFLQSREQRALWCDHWQCHWSVNNALMGTPCSSLRPHSLNTQCSGECRDHMQNPTWKSFLLRLPGSKMKICSSIFANPQRKCLSVL